MTSALTRYMRKPPIYSAHVMPSLRQMIKQATGEVHQRLHLHPGFAAVQNGSISLKSYQRLLARLYGFYVPFEIEAQISPERSQWLERDLDATDRVEMALTLPPLCTGIPQLKSPERLLGAMYVVEGSAVGGRVLAANLDNLLGHGVREGRQFFEGRGTATGFAWHRYLAQLDHFDHDPDIRDQVVGAALETFLVFECWLDGWSTLTHE